MLDGADLNDHLLRMVKTNLELLAGCKHSEICMATGSSGSLLHRNLVHERSQIQFHCNKKLHYSIIIFPPTHSVHSTVFYVCSVGA